MFYTMVYNNIMIYLRTYYYKRYIFILTARRNPSFPSPGTPSRSDYRTSVRRTDSHKMAARTTHNNNI